MNHSFNVEVAKQCGVHAAVLFENIMFWILHHQANNTYFKDGRTWTYNTKKAFADLFPYMNERQVRYAIQKLIDAGLIMDGDYNKRSFDHTKWYALTDYAISQFCNIDLTKLSIRSDKIVSAIPIINTNINNSMCNSEFTNSPKHAKETKKKKFTPPSLAEVKTYASSRGNKVDAQRFFDYFEAADWHDSQGKQVKNWKQKMISWENHSSNNTQPSQQQSIQPSMDLSGYDIEATINSSNAFMDDLLGDSNNE